MIFADITSGNSYGKASLTGDVSVSVTPEYLFQLKYDYNNNFTCAEELTFHTNFTATNTTG